MKFRKKPVIIEAIQYTGGNIMEVMNFVERLSENHNCESMYYVTEENEYFIKTLEGNMQISKNDYLIQEPFPTRDRRFYPCKPDIFEKTYEACESNEFYNKNNIEHLKKSIDQLNNK